MAKSKRKLPEAFKQNAERLKKGEIGPKKSSSKKKIASRKKR